MRRLSVILVLLLIAGGLYFSMAAKAMEEKEQSADLVLENGFVYTMDCARTWKEAVAISAGKVVGLGSSSQMQGFVGPSTKVIDLAGRMVLPGLHDSHVHLVDGGIHLQECNLDECKTKESVLEKN